MAKPAVIVISSHVVRGTVGNRAAVFALEVLGHPVWVVPTVTLSWHPGHGPATRIVPPAESFSRMLDDLQNAPWLDEVGAVLSGYLGDEEQVSPIARLVGAAKARNPNTLYALDPVMGDGDNLYVPEKLALGIKEQLLPLADLVTPNPFELAWLSGMDDLQNNEIIIEAAGSLDVSTVLATSAHAMMRGNTGNLLLHGGKAWLAEHRLMDGPPNGLGDLTAALMLANWLGRGEAGPDAALARTTASVYETMAVSAKAGADELLLERSLQSLIKPQTRIDVRTLMVGKK